MTTLVNSKKDTSSKKIANWSLGIMAMGFLATLPINDSVTGKLLQGGFEAGLIGGLADWFAVTALFRHPLNIKIPHTALLPKNRARITQTILHVLENEWLTKKSIIAKIEHVHLGNLLVGKVETELQKDEVKKQIQDTLLHLAPRLNLDPIKPQLESWMKELMYDIKTERAVQKAIDLVLDNSLEEKLYTAALKVAENKLADPQTKSTITKMMINAIEKNTEHKIYGSALKSMVNKARGKMTEIINVAITDFLNDLNNENSENRTNIISYIRYEIEQAKTNKTLIQQIETQKQRSINEYDMTPLIGTLNKEIQKLVLAYVGQEKFTEEILSPLIDKGLRKLKEHPTALSNLDAWVKGEALDLIEQNHQKIGQLVKDNLETMTDEEITDLLEDKLGNDITWIRVNGALCGSLIGLVLTGIKLLAG